MHNLIEIAIMRAQVLTVRIQGQTQVIKPIDIKTQDAQEFVVFIDQNNEQQTLRADQISLEL